MDAPNPKIKRQADRSIAMQLVRRIFQNIANELGEEEACRIFKSAAKPMGTPHRISRTMR